MVAAVAEEHGVALYGQADMSLPACRAAAEAGLPDGVRVPRW
jgi:hypothetical protein